MTRLPRWSVCLPIALASLPACTEGDTGSTPAEQARPMSVVLVLMDDLWLDGAAYMPSVEARRADAIVFDRAYVDTPLCCPARASLLSGGFLAQHTGVLTNIPPNGGAIAFVDTASLPVHLQAAGYRTALYGKYLNILEDLGDYVPPGWDDYRAYVVEDDFDTFDIVAGSSTPDAPGVATRETVEAYVTDSAGAAALAFLGEAGDDPFFLYLPFNAPHSPAAPADQDVGVYAGATLHRGAYNEEDVTDKPAYVQRLPRIDDASIEVVDQVYVQALESLVAADRAIEAVFQALEASGRIEDTLVVFASDNGFLWGEHRLIGKGHPYQESVHVPLYLWIPGAAPATRSDLVSVSLDLGATLYDAANVDAPTNGTSLLVEGATARDSLVLEAADIPDTPSYTGVVTAEWKYVEYVSGEKELYDLVADPFEEQNVAEDDAHAELRATLAEVVADNRLLTLGRGSTTLDRGEPIDLAVDAFGGVAPVTFEIVEGSLPDGVTMSEDGVFTGAPAASGSYVVGVRATDSSVSPYHGGPQTYTTELAFEVGESTRRSPPPGPSVRAGAHAATLRASAPAGGRLVLSCGLTHDLDAEPHRVEAWAPRGGEALFRLEGLRADTPYACRVDGLGELARFTFRTGSAR